LARERKKSDSFVKQNKQSISAKKRVKPDKHSSTLSGKIISDARAKLGKNPMVYYYENQPDKNEIVENETKEINEDKTFEETNKKKIDNPNKKKKKKK